MNETLRREFEYFLAHHSEMVGKYSGKVVVICGESVVGDFPTEMAALTYAETSLKPGTFLIQKVKETTAEYTQTFHSRVAFA